MFCFLQIYNEDCSYRLRHGCEVSNFIIDGSLFALGALESELKPVLYVSQYICNAFSSFNQKWLLPRRWDVGLPHMLDSSQSRWVAIRERQHCSYHPVKKKTWERTARHPFWSDQPFKRAFLTCCCVKRFTGSLTTADSVRLSHQSHLAVSYPSGSLFCRFLPIWFAGTPW